MRDAPAKLVDTYTNPKQYVRNTNVKYGLYVLGLVNARANILSLDETLRNVYDPYAFIRDAYLQHRAYLVSDGNVTDEPLVDPGADSPDSDTAAPSAPPPPVTPPASGAPP
jgi:phospholipid-binding lipoprotein MlaA